MHIQLYCSFLKRQYFFSWDLSFCQIRIWLPKQFNLKSYLNRAVMLYKGLLRVQQLVLISRLTIGNKNLINTYKIFSCSLEDTCYLYKEFMHVCVWEEQKVSEAETVNGGVSEKYLVKILCNDQLRYWKQISQSKQYMINNIIHNSGIIPVFFIKK